MKDKILIKISINRFTVKPVNELTALYIFLQLGRNLIQARNQILTYTAGDVRDFFHHRDECLPHLLPGFFLDGAHPNTVHRFTKFCALGWIVFIAIAG